MKNNRLQSLLVDRALVTARQLEDAIARTQSSGCTWLEHLIVTGILDEDRLCDVASRTAFVQRCAPAALVKVDRDILATLPSDVAVEHRVVPIGYDVDGDLRIVMLDPGDSAALEEVTFFANRPVVREVSTATSIAWALHQHYGARSALWPRAPRPVALVA